MVKAYTSIDGIKILVGENARDNDKLTFSSPHDYWWIHREGPGAHVVVCCDGEIPKETKRDACHLAIGAATACHVNITRCGLITKTKTLGKVCIPLEAARFFVKVDPNRLDRIKGKWFKDLDYNINTNGFYYLPSENSCKRQGF